MMTIPKVEGKLSDLKKHHHYFHTTLLKNQIKFMEGNVATAIEEFFTLNKLIERHMQAEEELLLPLYDKLISTYPPGGAKELFMHEHRLITVQLDISQNYFLIIVKTKRPEQ